MYDTAAESNTKISFDTVDPFYDVLPWFRLIGRYASLFTQAICTNQANSLLHLSLLTTGKLYCILLHFPLRTNRLVKYFWVRTSC